MGALFPRWTNTVFGTALLGLACGGVAVVAAPMIFVRTRYWREETEPAVQPVEFDHRHHVRDDGIDCYYCHSGAKRSAWAGVPPTELCMGCHSQIWNTSPLLAPVRQSYFSNLPIRWNRVTRIPDFVYFNHAIHVNKGVGCVSCHGRVDQMARVYQVVPLTMKWCLDCHRNPDPHLRPLNAVTDMEWEPQNESERAEIAVKLNVRRVTDCYGCHR